MASHFFYIRNLNDLSKVVKKVYEFLRKNDVFPGHLSKVGG